MGGLPSPTKCDFWPWHIWFYYILLVYSMELISLSTRVFTLRTARAQRRSCQLCIERTAVDAKQKMLLLHMSFFEATGLHLSYFLLAGNDLWLNTLTLTSVSSMGCRMQFTTTGCILTWLHNSRRLLHHLSIYHTSSYFIHYLCRLWIL